MQPDFAIPNECDEHSYAHSDVPLKASGNVIRLLANGLARQSPTPTLGTLFATKHELRVMSTPGRGSIVDISSTMVARGAAGGATFRYLEIPRSLSHQYEGIDSIFENIGAGNDQVPSSRRKHPAMHKTQTIDVLVALAESGDTGCSSYQWSRRRPTWAQC
jgi:hypothetical protein